MSRPLKERTNLLGSKEEHWKPPMYVAAEGVRAALRARLLRFFDLQAGTIWEDLQNELAGVQGTVVDVGCGVQPYRRLFGDRVRYIGIDYADTRDTFRVEAPDTITESIKIGVLPLTSQTLTLFPTAERVPHVVV